MRQPRAMAERHAQAFGFTERLQRLAPRLPDPDTIMPTIKILPHHELCPQGASISAPAGTSVRVLIGDTPLDVQAARANGLKAVAVATGWVSAEELAAAGADLVLPDFSNTDACVAQLESLL